MSTFIKDNTAACHRLSFRGGPAITTPHIKKNGTSVDPQLHLDGAWTVMVGFAGGTNSQFAFMLTAADLLYTSTSTLIAANIGKNAAGEILLFFPSLTDNTAILGSDGSMPSANVAGWWNIKFPSGTFAASNWLVSLVLINPSTATYAVIVGARFYQNSATSTVTTLAQSIAQLQYAADSFVAAGAAASQTFQFSVSLSGAGAAGALVMSGDCLYTEIGVKVTSASSKSGSRVQLRTNG